MSCSLMINTTCIDIFMDLLGVDETVATADICYFYGAVSVGGESS